MKIIPKEIKKYQWLLTGALFLLLLYALGNESQTGITVSYDMLALIVGGVAILLFMRKKDSERYEDAGDLVKLLRVKEGHKNLDWRDWTAMTVGDLYLIRGNDTDTYGVDSGGNVKFKIPIAPTELFDLIQTSEILSKAVSKDVQEEIVKEKIRERGFEVENE